MNDLAEKMKGGQKSIDAIWESYEIFNNMKEDVHFHFSANSLECSSFLKVLIPVS